MALVATALVAVQGTGQAAPARADDASQARRHAQRASSLAAQGKCRQAVVEFDKALAVLRDPALLFNRGECHRKLGDADAAIDDYKQFLSDLPKAPNRPEVERRIAELSRKPPNTPLPAPPGRDAPPASGGVAPPKVEAVGAHAAPVSPSASDPRGSSLPLAATPAPPLPREVVVAPRATEGTASVDLAAVPDGTAAHGADGGITTRPWFWIAVAAVAVGAGVGTFLLLNHDGTTVPSSALGNYQF